MQQLVILETGGICWHTRHAQVFGSVPGIWPPSSLHTPYSTGAADGAYLRLPTGLTQPARDKPRLPTKSGSSSTARTAVNASRCNGSGLPCNDS
jgi:hypothetical protein